MNLQKARYLKFQKQAATGKVNPDILPPTKNSTLQHSLHVHLQIATWKYLNTSIFNPIGTGWELDFDRKIRPKMFTGSIAPEKLKKHLLQL